MSYGLFLHLRLIWGRGACDNGEHAYLQIPYLSPGTYYIVVDGSTTVSYTHLDVYKRQVCKHIHLPVQSRSSRILKLMNRKYTREWYLDRVAAIKRIIPD